MKFQRSQNKIVLNMSDTQTKRRLMAKVGSMSGLWEFRMKPRKRQRTLDQNEYYWAAFVTPFAEWLVERWGDRSIAIEDAHEELKKKLLPERRYVNRDTREIMVLAPSTVPLTTEEFSDYLERAAKFLAEFCDIVVLPADMFTEKSA